jgi:hypothetical protein
MSEDVKLVWLSVRDPHPKKVEANEGMGYDGKVPVGRVSLASGDPTNRGAWRWSMFGYGRNCRGQRAEVKRAGAAATKDEAKADCERAYLELLASDPENRQAIREHHATVEERARLWESGEGLRMARETERSGSS